MTVHLTPLAIIAGILLIVSFLGVTWKLLRFIFKVDRALPVLLNLADQFENNSGSTIKDKVDNIPGMHDKLKSLTLKTDEVIIQNQWAVKLAESSRLVAETNASIVKEISEVQTEEMYSLRAELSEKLYTLQARVDTVNHRATASDERSVRIESRLDQILPIIIRRHNSDLENDKRSKPENDMEI